MKILHILSKPSGGAGSASIKIIEALAKYGADQHHIIYGLGNLSNEHAYKITPAKHFPMAQINRLMFSLAKKGQVEGLESFTPAETYLRNQEISGPINSSDLIHFHWLGDRQFDLKNLLHLIPENKPIVATMHDMNFITGGCHYSNGCQQYLDACLKCPQLPGLFGGLICKQSFQTKAKGYTKHKLALVPASKWLENEARASHLGQCANRIQRIGYSFPGLKYPISQEKARERLAIKSTSKKLILLAAQNLSNPRKGATLLLEAYEKGMLPDCAILTIGDKLDVIGGEIHQLGFVKDPELLRCAYASADVFCLPSLEENLAQTGIESLSEGTPVVCFSETGPSDYVQDQVTGINCNERTPSALAQAILQCIQQGDLTNRSKVRDAYRQRQEAEYSQDVISAKYENLYNSMLNQ